jgi:hypothetical protein
VDELLEGLYSTTVIFANFSTVDPYISIEKLAQNGRGIKRSAQTASEFLCCLAARIRALRAITHTVGIGANTAIFISMNGAPLKPRCYRG